MVKNYGGDIEARNKNPLLPQHPYRMQISGPSGSGKTNFLLNLLLDKKQPFDEVYVFYTKSQRKYEILAEQIKCPIRFFIGLPTESQSDPNKGTISVQDFEQIINTDFDKIQRAIIFDDLMNEIEKNKDVSKLFTAGCHHCNLSVITLTQKIFVNREQRLQTDYLVIFAFPADKSSIMQLARQLEPIEYKQIVQMYNEAINIPHGFLMIDLKCERIGNPLLKYRNSDWDRIFELDEDDE